MSDRFNIETIEVSGFPAFLESLRIPFKLPLRSEYTASHALDEICDNHYRLCCVTNIDINVKDIKLASKLIKAGDEHAKSIRLITVDCSINAPLWWWAEMCTYEVGVTKGCSESTMHCECKGMKGEDLQVYKDNIPSGLLQRRIYKFSYQTLTRIYYQRKTHRLPVWHEFIDWVEQLPMFDLLIKKNTKLKNDEKNKN